MVTSYTKKELASIAGYTYRRLHDIDMALPDNKKLFVLSKDGNKYDLALFVQRWAQYCADRKEEEQGTLDDAKTAHEFVKMEKTQIEVAKLRGELVNVEDVRRLWGNVAVTVTQNMIRLPSKIAPRLIMQRDVDKIAGIIEKEIKAVLTAIAETPLPEDHEEDDESDEAEE